ncbi:Dedicator of cytokinesis C-terminal [Kalmanozyma brasiliensis GHG001]|uniref:Dedicator of cytokinesis protein 3 n=1 Tax=Kalmanozyma brasiliensis (strain GHG001) TaxID=1365824 RepID=V5ET77_KALBG|nr:Dedicator of cytokinesis C-terminal [Kalmanozyma brasiliensis GHG001]EST06223.1 Dedicator of cytokinesis C-terminal [Kalmanozyma brasiliensis GHG001]
MASASSYRRWEPLPKILYGLATHPFSPETDPLESSAAFPELQSADAIQNLKDNLIALELGDEVYVFEQLGHDNVGWYRGYVVSTNRMPTTAASASSLSDYSTFHAVGQQTSASASEEPQVYVGVFPPTHVHIREQLDDAEMRLASVYQHAKELGVVGATGPLPRQNSQMGTLAEVDETAASSSSPNPQSSTQFASNDDAIQEVGVNGHLVERPPPPLPSLQFGDATRSGANEPLVDEIACALREWSALLYSYLGQRDYGLLNTVKEQIEALYTARKQLLAQTLSAEEVTKLRRECVARLVKANVAQGLDVIVRHPGRGGLVDFDLTSKSADPDSWVSGIRLSALQAALAYVDQQEDNSSTAAPGGMDLSASNAFGITSPTTNSAGVLAGISNDPSQHPGTTSRKGSLATTALTANARASNTNEPGSLLAAAAAAQYFHVFIELRAFVATPCTAGEVAELYFSLYNRAESRFLTEEFCVLLNHRGVPATDSVGQLNKMRALFTELSASDMNDLNVVCRIVRKGGMRVGDLRANPLGAAGQDQLSDRTDTFTDPSLANTLSFRTKRMTGDRSFRRPFGCAVLELGQHHQFQTDIASSSTMKEHVMPIFVPVHEAAFSTLHQDIIASRTREFEKSPRADMLVVNVKVFHGQTSAVIRENPSLLQDTPPTARLGFPDVVFPGDTRNEAYIKLWSGEFYPSGNKMAGNSLRNIQVSAEVRTRDGRVVEDVISRGAGESTLTQFDSLVFYHQNAPTWGELIKLQLPHDIMEDCHLFFSFRHRSSKEERGAVAPSNGAHGTQATQSSSSVPVSRPFAYGYLPLFESNRAFIPDGSHTLFLWRTNRPANQIGPDLYFNLPPVTSSGRSLNDIVPASLASSVQPLRDILTLRTFLVSTKYSQNDVLLKLLSWERLLVEDFEELRSVLNQFTFVGEVEIVKFLRDIFDSLFGVVTSSRNSRGELDDLVFNSLVTVLGIVQDRRFNNFRATLDVYIEQHFKSTTAHDKLIASMSKLMADPARPDTSKDLRAAIKVWPYLFKFVIQSRENQRGDRDVGGGAVLDHLEASFKRELEGLLRSINQLMSTTKPSSIIGTQTLALQHFAGILPDLARVFTTDELVRTATAFADSVFIAKGKMVIWKLLHILQLTQGPLFEEPASRSQMIPSIVRWIGPHLGAYDEAAHAPGNALESARDAARVSWLESARLAVTILAVILDRLQVSLAADHQEAPNGKPGSRGNAPEEQDDVDYLLSMMPKLLETYRELSSRATIRTLERHRAPSTTPSPVPVIFPSSYPFPLVARRPQGTGSVVEAASSRRNRRQERSEFLNCGLVEISAVLMVLIVLSPRKHLSSFLDEERDLGGDEKTSKILFHFFEVATSILSYDAYPSTWLNLNIFSHQMVLKMADPIASMMVRYYIPTAEQSDKFDTVLWRSCLTMILTLLSSDQLVIEQFKPQRRRAVWRLAGDIRGEGAQIFAKLWTSIGWPEKAGDDSVDEQTSQSDERMNTGGFQVQFVPSLVEPVLELCLSHHDELRTCAVRVLATMITSEWHLNGDFSVIEAEIIDKLDILFLTQTKGDEISRAFFIGQLRALFDSPSVDAALREQVNACLISVNRFLDLLLSVRSLPLEEGYEDERIAGTLKLLGFLRQSNRVTAFSTHVLRLVNLHLENHNYIEAALTLKLHADLHSWDMDSFVEPILELDLPRQSHFARKETLYMLILDFLSKGQAWEISVDVCRELVQQYEYRSVNFARLAEVLQHQAKLYQKIATEERSFPAYFRVAYYGQEWPPSLQNKMFVYRGHDREKFAAFCDRLHAKHPKATLIKSAAVPDEAVRSSEGQFVQVTAVQPEPDRTKDIFTNPEVPPTVRAYHENNGTDLFSFTRPLTRAGAASSEQWTEKTYLRCEDAFPTVLRRSEVAEVYVAEISPLEKALEDVRAKTGELETLEKKYTSMSKASTGKVNTNRLSMALNGAVDAPADGGVPMYKRTFFASDYLATHEDQQEVVEELRQAIDVQATVLFRCIRLHAQLCPPEMKPFHDTLERFFVQNFSEEIQRLDLDVRKLGEATSDSVDLTNGIGEDDASRSPERTMTRGFTTGMGAMGRAAVGNGFSAADEGRQDLQTTAQPGYGRRGDTSQSPLQRHIAFLTKQSEPLASREAPAATAPAVAVTAPAPTAAAPVASSALTTTDSTSSATPGATAMSMERSKSARGSKTLAPITEDTQGGVADMPAAAPTIYNDWRTGNSSTADSALKQSTIQRNDSAADLSSIKGSTAPSKQPTRFSKLIGRRKGSGS